MAAAHLCKCGHQYTDHHTKTVKGISFKGACEWADCNCQEYDFKKLRPSNYRNKGAPLNALEPMFTPNEDFGTLTKFKKFKKKEVFLSDCNQDGFIVNPLQVKNPRFNNGEYP
jgi:hypothetical protein